MASALCGYCGSTLQPNSSYCLGCGQLVTGTVHDEAAVDPGWEHEVPRPPRPRPQSAPQSAPAVDIPVAAPEAQRWPAQVELVFGTGERVTIAGDAIVGRKPGQTAANVGAQAIEVDDPERSVSRVHLYLELADGSLVAGDAGSSNGSSIERSGRRIPLPAGGERSDVRPGDLLWVGDVEVRIDAV